MMYCALFGGAPHQDHRVMLSRNTASTSTYNLLQGPAAHGCLCTSCYDNSVCPVSSQRKRTVLVTQQSHGSARCMQGRGLIFRTNADNEPPAFIDGGRDTWRCPSDKGTWGYVGVWGGHALPAEKGLTTFEDEDTSYR